MPATTLPEIIPVFPLTGSLLLPGNLLPLNIFEPRYRNLVADAFEQGKHIGMIQPIVPRLDNFGPMEPLLLEDTPKLYGVGCVGRLAQLGAVVVVTAAASSRPHAVARASSPSRRGPSESWT
jgi:Lon protease-like protein